MYRTIVRNTDEVIRLVGWDGHPKRFGGHKSWNNINGISKCLSIIKSDIYSFKDSVKRYSISILPENLGGKRILDIEINFDKKEYFLNEKKLNSIEELISYLK